jgi:hypothetical protein
MKNKDNLRLHRFECLEDGERRVDWVWLTDSEVSSYLGQSDSVVGLQHRLATSDEEELYDESYNDGYSLAMVEERVRYDNGVTFSVELDSMDSNELITHKLFQCGYCDERKDFETDVAMANGFYICTQRDDTDVMWHVCYDCASMEIEVTFDS